MVAISAVIITYNEEKSIARCIDSVRAVVEEVVIVDSYSKDNTRAICLAKGARFIENPFTGFTAQKQFSVAQATHDIVLALDADEYLSEELTQSILQVKNNWTADGYDFNRLNSYAGKWIKSSGWYPDRKIRLWDRRKGNWGGGKVHETVQLIAGATQKTLNGDLLHESYHQVSELIIKGQLRYAELYAEEHRFKKEVTAFKIFYKTVGAFFKTYILKKGILDGYEGLVISASAANNTFYKYAMLLEQNRKVSISLIIIPTDSLTLKKILSQVKSQTVLPDEIIISVTGDDMKTAITQADLPAAIAVTMLSHTAQTLSARQTASLQQATKAYILLLTGHDLGHSKTIAAHKALVKKDTMIVSDFSRESGTQLMSFWKEDAERAVAHSINRNIGRKRPVRVPLPVKR